MTEVEGARSLAGALYPHVAHLDDGTWWEQLQPGHHGYGIAVWTTSHVSASDIHWWYQAGEFPSSLDPGFSPALVEWSADRYSIQGGLVVRIHGLWCFDKPTETRLGFDQDYDTDSRSCCINLIDGSHIIDSGFDRTDPPGYYLPVWSVVPIDDEYFHAWHENMIDHWTFVTRAEEFYDEGFHWMSDMEEKHVYRVSYGNDGCEVLEVCAAYEFEHTCGRADEGQPGRDCDRSCSPVDVDHGNCDCGLTAYLDSAELLVERADPTPSIAHHQGVFSDTWQYALERFHTGWVQCCTENLERSHSWFTSLWRRFSPFVQPPGRVVRAQTPSTVLTGSLTQQAS